MENTVTDKTGSKLLSPETAKMPQRSDVLRRLNHDIEWLRQKAHTKTLIHPTRIMIFRACVYGYSVLLQGLKDEELEIRIAELEEKLKGAVIIPSEQGKKS